MIDPGRLTAEEYADYRNVVGPKRQLWENNGWSVRGRDNGVDYLFWGSPYFIQGLPEASYLPEQIALNQTLMITHDASAPDELVDNDFIAVGWDRVDYLSWDEVVVGREGPSVTWQFPGRTYLASPPSWSISGSHAQVGTDLSINLIAEPMWFTDPNEGIDERTDRWWIANGSASGRIWTMDQFLTVTNAHAVHERHIHCGTSHDPISLLSGGGVVWFTVSGEEITCAVLARPSKKSAWAQLTLKGQTIEVKDDAITFTTERTWLDPATEMVIGQTWRVVVRHPDGQVELRIQAKARAYYLWNFLADGKTMLYWWLCTASATLNGSGPEEHIEGLVAEAHLNRTFYRRHGGRHG